jgi:hypothetical protein
VATTTSPMRGVPITLHTAGGAAAPGLVLALPDSFKHHTIIIKGSAGIASGAIQPEVADVYDYAGTWAPIGGGPVAVVASSEIVVNFEGVFKFFRARISTLMGGGTVNVIYVGS